MRTNARCSDTLYIRFNTIQVIIYVAPVWVELKQGYDKCIGNTDEHLYKRFLLWKTACADEALRARKKLLHELKSAMLFGYREYGWVCLIINMSYRFHVRRLSKPGVDITLAG